MKKSLFYLVQMARNDIANVAVPSIAGKVYPSYFPLEFLRERLALFLPDPYTKLYLDVLIGGPIFKVGQEGLAYVRSDSQHASVRCRLHVHYDDEQVKSQNLEALSRHFFEVSFRAFCEISIRVARSKHCLSTPAQLQASTLEITKLVAALDVDDWMTLEVMQILNSPRLQPPSAGNGPLAPILDL
ncbi:MAG: hypothetical protein ABL949_05445 [Fimbriimonadaceae bacterium]